MATSGSKGGWENEDLAKGGRIAGPDFKGLEFTQLLWEVVGLWKVRKPNSLGLGRGGLLLNCRKDRLPSKWGGGVCRGAMRRDNSKNLTRFSWA